MTSGLEPRRLFSYLIILAIAVVFVLQFGPGSRGCDVRQAPSLAAATVNGKDIPLEELSRIYAQQLTRIRRMAGRELPDDVIKRAVNPTEIVNHLVDGELLMQAAEREGVIASDVEVREILHKNPDFQRNGKFDYGRYTDVLRQYYRKTPGSFETDLRRQLSAGKLVQIVEAGAVVSEDEVKARYRREGNRATVGFVRFLPAMYADGVKPLTPAELQKYAEGHADAIAKEYAANKPAYRTSEQVRVRRILLKTSPLDSPEKKAEVRGRLDAIKKEIEGGKDFAQVARDASEDTATKASGGDLGLKSRESSGWAPAFARVAFSLEAGKVSEPVETPEGWQLLKVEERKAPEERPLDAVKTQIALQLYKREKAFAEAKSKAEAALAKVKAGKKLADLFPAANAAMAFATETKPERVESGSFSLDETAVPKLGAAPEVLAAVRERSEVGFLPQLFPAGEGFALVEVTERKRPDDTDFQAQKAQLFDEALRGKRTELQSAYVQSLKKGATIVTHESAITTLTSDG